MSTLTVIASLLVAAAGESTGGVAVSGATAVVGVWDNNALLGRRGQFLDTVAGGGARTDVAMLPAVELGLVRRLGGSARLSFDARLQPSWLRSTPQLRGLDANARLAAELSLPTQGRLRPALTLGSHSDEPGWSYQVVSPGLEATHTFDWGLLATGRYAFTSQQFDGGSSSPRASYANVDNRLHAAELDLRLWVAESLRLNLVADSSAASFEGNLNPNLADYAGLGAAVARTDLGFGLGASVLASWPALVVSAGARVERNGSNSPAFDYWAAHALGDVLWRFHGAHSLYGQVDWARYDFSRERFDLRFLNTRLDYRLSLWAGYRLQLTPALRAELSYRREQSISNDCAGFDPQRDARGLPVYSRSYSCFSRDRLEASFRYEL